MSVDLPKEVALEQAFDYYDAVTKEDVTRVDGVKRSSERVCRLMRAYARHQGTQASIATLKDMFSSSILLIFFRNYSYFKCHIKRRFAEQRCNITRRRHNKFIHRCPAKDIRD